MSLFSTDRNSESTNTLIDHSHKPHFPLLDPGGKKKVTTFSTSKVNGSPVTSIYSFYVLLLHHQSFVLLNYSVKSMIRCDSLLLKVLFLISILIWGDSILKTCFVVHNRYKRIGGSTRSVIRSLKQNQEKIMSETIRNQKGDWLSLFFRILFGFLVVSTHEQV